MNIELKRFSKSTDHNYSFGVHQKQQKLEAIVKFGVFLKFNWNRYLEQKESLFNFLHLYIIKESKNIFFFLFFFCERYKFVQYLNIIVLFPYFSAFL